MDVGSGSRVKKFLLVVAILFFSVTSIMSIGVIIREDLEIGLFAFMTFYTGIQIMLVFCLVSLLVHLVKQTSNQHFDKKW